MKKTIFTLLLGMMGSLGNQSCTTEQVPYCPPPVECSISKRVSNIDSQSETYAEIGDFLEENQYLLGMVNWDCKNVCSDGLLESIVNKMVAFEEGTFNPELPQTAEIKEGQCYYGTEFYFDEKTSQDIFTSQVAFSLYLEKNKILNWSLEDYSNEELNLLFNNQSYFVGKGDLFGSPYYLNWDQAHVFHLLSEEGIIQDSAEETLYALTDWIMKHLEHEAVTFNLNKAIERYGYPDITRIESLFNTYDSKNPIAGCWGMTDFYQLVLATLNIPAKEGITSFPPGYHSRAEFPSLKLGLFTSDDVYSFNISSERNIPVEDIFLPLEKIQQMTSVKGDAPSVQDIALWNHKKHRNDLDRKYLPDDFLLWRVCYLLGGTSISTEKLLNPPELYKPIYSIEEVNKTIKELDQLLYDIGGGDLEEAERELRRRLK